MPISIKRVLFLDGMGCNPDGFKSRYLASLGYRVTAPMLPDLDFPASVAIANQAIVETRPDVIVGYSRGGAVALMIDDQSLPRILVAPALHWVPDGRGSLARVVIIHSSTDDSLPIEGLLSDLTRCNITNAELRVTGEDHTMIDDAALASLKQALQELTS